MSDERTDFGALIPELNSWNEGRGIAAEDWIGCAGNYPLAIGYSLILWPRFVRFEEYVLREGFSEMALRGFARQEGSSRKSVEWVMNHIHLSDIHYDAECDEAQLRYLGRVMKEIHELKLRAEFPDLHFVVEFDDERGLDLVDYQISFWQENSEGEP